MGITRVLALIAVMLAALSVSPAAGAERQKATRRTAPAATTTAASLAEAVERSRAEMMAAARVYQASLQKVLAFHEADLKRATEESDKRQDLFARGIVSQRELEESLQRMDAVRAKIEDTRKELAQADTVLAEAITFEPAAKADDSTEEPGPVQPWSLAEAPKIERFFSARFGHALPVSAFGQTALHNRMGFDHHNALDVAVHPDSPEGQVLIAYLRRSGIPFIAFRGPVPGAATGAHVHIGEASRRVASHVGHVKRAKRTRVNR